MPVRLRDSGQGRARPVSQSEHSLHPAERQHMDVLAGQAAKEGSYLTTDEINQCSIPPRCAGFVE